MSKVVVTESRSAQYPSPRYLGISGCCLHQNPYLTRALFLTGAVAARFRIFDSGLTIIASHLSSGEQEGDELKRNYDYSEIVRRAQFPPDSSPLEPDSLQAGAAPDVKIAGLGRSPGQWGRQKGLLDSTHIVWMGDLNYRLTMPDAQVCLLGEG